MRKDVEKLFAAAVINKGVGKDLGIGQFNSAKNHANEAFPGSMIRLDPEDFNQLYSAYNKANQALARQLANGEIKDITSEMVLKGLALAYNSEIRKV
jgi:hypothetical protein